MRWSCHQRKYDGLLRLFPITMVLALVPVCGFAYLWCWDSVDRDRTNEELGVDLFGAIDAIECVRMTNGDWVTFALDPIWCRVIAANYETAQIVAFGSYGSGVGQFKYPQGLAADSVGNVIVSDTGNNRLVRLYYDGSSLSYVSTVGASSGLSSPMGVDLFGSEYESPSGRIYVADSGNSRIVRFSLDGELTASSFPPGTDPVAPSAPYFPTDVACGQGDLCTVDASQRRVVHFIDAYDLLGAPELWWDGDLDLGEHLPCCSEPYSIDVDFHGCEYVVDKTGSLVIKRLFNPWYYDFSQPCFYVYGSHGMGIDKLYYPRGVSNAWQWNLIGVSEEWTNRSGAKELLIDLEITEFRVCPEQFDPECGQRVAIEFVLTDWARLVDVIVVDQVTGDTVRTLRDDDVMPSGYKCIYWDGRNDAGEIVTNGVYDIHVSAEHVYGDPYGDDHPTAPVSMSVTVANLAHVHDRSSRINPGCALEIISNPSRISGRVVFLVKAPQDAAVRIYSVEGRLIHVLHTDGGDGRCEVVWNGRDQEGSIVSPGIYFVRLDGEAGSISKKVVILE